MAISRNPYSDLPAQAFWKSGVVERSGWDNLFVPKFPLDAKAGITTVGSCFAQHIRKGLVSVGLDPLDCEPAPSGLTPSLAASYGFGLHSGRYGNIYTPRHLLQLLHDIDEKRVFEGLVWEKDGRYYDALRPNVEPKGLRSVEEVLELRRDHLTQLNGLFSMTDVLIFTLGLTEGWVHRETGRVLPISPGVIAGDYDEDAYVYQNFSFWDIKQDLEDILALLREFNPSVKILLTVSPVPLTATASGNHVMMATGHSKALLRTAAGELTRLHKAIDYFPSYEIVTTWARDRPAFKDNMRSVRSEVVEEVLACFTQSYGLSDVVPSEKKPILDSDLEYVDELVCEEILLETMRK